MEPKDLTAWEQSLQTIARRLDYPPTPDLTAAFRDEAGADRRAIARRRPPRLAWALLAVALLLLALLAVPQTRAALLTLFARVGAIDIFVDPGAPAPILTPSPATATAPVATTPPDSVGEGRAAGHSLELFELGEATTLDAARLRMDFSLMTPRALGEPDEVYLHTNVDLPAVTLVWQGEDGQTMSLTEIGIAEFAQKLVHEESVARTVVGDYPAVWLAGPHRLQLLGNWQESSLLIDSNVLIWTDGTVTYRFESHLTLEEAQRIGASLAPVVD